MDQPQRSVRGRPPDHVLFACMLAYVGIALGLLIWLVIAVLYGFHLPIAEGGWFQPVSFLVITAVVVVAAVPMFILIRLAQQGRRWARIGLTVLGVLLVLAGVAPLVSKIVVLIPVSVYSLVWLVLLWWGPTSWRARGDSRPPTITDR